MTAPLEVSVELRDAAWADVAGIGAAIAGLAGSLGLDVAPEVSVRTAGPPRPDGLPLGLWVGSSPVRYGEGLCRSIGDRSAALLCRHACAQRAGVLMGPAQSAAYAARLRGHGVQVPGDAWLREVLSGVLDLGIAVRDEAAVAEVLNAREDDHGPAVREALISRLAGASLRLLAPPPVAEGLAAFDPGQGSDLLTAVVSLIAQETGVALPPLRTADPDGLPDGTFALQVNDVATPPAPLPAADSLLVDCEPGFVRLVCGDAAPTATTMPGSAREASLVTTEHRAELDGMGFATWDRAGQLALMAAACLRERIGWCVHQDRLQAQLDAVQAQTPRTVLAARTACPPWQLAVLVRGLATDHIPLTDMPGLLERLIELPYAGLPEARLSILDDPVTAVGAGPPPADPVEAFVRTGLCRTIARTRLGGNDAVEVVLLEPATERRLRAALDPAAFDPAAFDPAADELLDAVAGWLAGRPGPGDVPLLLVADDLRAPVADTLRLVFPTIRVAAYGDLPADLLVIPENRLTLEKP